MGLRGPRGAHRSAARWSSAAGQRLAAGRGAPSSSQTAGSPGAGSPAKQGVAGYRAVGGAVVLVSRTIPVRGGRASVRLRCTAPVACRGRLTLEVSSFAKAARRSRRAIAIATVRFSISGRRTATLELRLDAAGRTDLRAARGRLHAGLAIGVFAPDPPRRRTYAVKLVRQHIRRVKHG